MLLEGDCYIGITSYLTTQRYTKNVKKPNILLKKNLGRGKNNLKPR